MIRIFFFTFNIVLLVILPFVGSSQVQLRDFKVVITLESFSPIERIILEYFGTKTNSEIFHVDSIIPVSETTIFSGKILEPWKASLVIKYKQKYQSGRHRRETYTFFLSSDTIQINAQKSLENIKIIGPQSTLDFTNLQKQELIYTHRKDSLLDKLFDCEDSKNYACSTRIEEELQILEQEKREKIYISYYIENPKSPLAIFALKEGMPINIEETLRYQTLFEMLPETSRQNPSAIKLKSRIIGAKESQIGKQAINFTQMDTLGNPISLSFFNGKYLLIDFWASWCIPCRKQHPALIEIYQKYKKFNFEILSVALERKNDKNKWVEAIKTDGLAWYQVSDLNYWDNEVAELYGVGSLPSNLLLNPKGIIIAKNLEPQELAKVLSDLILIEKK